MKNVKYLLLIIAIIGGAFLISSIFSSQNKADLRKEIKKSAPREKIITVKNKNHVKIILTSGRMRAFYKVEIYAEVTGILKENSIDFKSGNRFKKGEKMIEINSDVYQNSLLAQKGNLLNLFAKMLADAKIDFPGSYDMWKEYIGSYDLAKPLKPLPENLSQKELFYLATHNILKSYYDVKSMEETYSKYTIKAPFDGYVTSSSINPGTLVRSGQKLGEFLSPSLFEMEAPVKYSDLKFIHIGSEVGLTSDDGKIIKGKVVRINKGIDPQSQSVKIIIQSRSGDILDGMFFSVTIKAKTEEKLVELPFSAVDENGAVSVKTENGTKKIHATIVDRTLTDVFVKGLDDGAEVILGNKVD
ncbi:MAG: HlyD family efflux transporter periplasmic adaptor subunit [Chlorobi bacterium]|nr:HlyD family efflux transporter periplasmic adaptor subunit [Chlorobiota bacterium]